MSKRRKKKKPIKYSDNVNLRRKTGLANPVVGTMAMTEKEAAQFASLQAFKRRVTVAVQERERDRAVELRAARRVRVIKATPENDEPIPF